MDHARIVRTVLGVTAAYLVALGCWLGWIVPLTPPGTVPLQVITLVGLFGTFLGLGMLLAQRPTRSDRKLRKHGLEGWANIEAVHPYNAPTTAPRSPNWIWNWWSRARRPTTAASSSTWNRW